PLGQQNETGYEVGHDGLQAKPDADRKGAGNQGDLLQIETEPRKCNADRRDRADIAEDGDDRQLKTWLQSSSGQQLRLEPALNNTRNDQEQEQQQGARHHRFERKMDLADLESKRDVANRVEQVGGGYFPWADDQQERSQDQHHANACREQRAPKPEGAGADAKTRGERLPFGALLADRGKQRLRDHEQKIQSSERCRGHNDSQRHECGKARITRDERERDQRRQQQAQRVGPGRDNERAASLRPDLPQPDDE